MRGGGGGRAFLLKKTNAVDWLKLLTGRADVFFCLFCFVLLCFYFIFYFFYCSQQSSPHYPCPLLRRSLVYVKVHRCHWLGKGTINRLTLNQHSVSCSTCSAILGGSPNMAGGAAFHCLIYNKKQNKTERCRKEQDDRLLAPKRRQLVSLLSFVCRQGARYLIIFFLLAPVCRESSSRKEKIVVLFVGWLLNVPATGECISGTDLLRQFYVLPH